MRDDRTRRYALGPAVRTLANAHIGTLDWAERATPLLRELVTVTGETANLAVLDRTRAVVVAQAQSTRMVRMFAELGNRMPLHCTGCGKVLLAHFPDSAVAAIIAETGLPPSTPSSIGSLEELREELARIRRRGYVVDNEEREEGLRCVAVPVRDAAGDVVAAISIAGPSGRVDNARIEPLARELRRIGDALGAPHGAADVPAGDPDAGERASSGASGGAGLRLRSRVGAT